MSKPLPEFPNLEHLRKQAKELLAYYRSHDSEAVARFSSLPGKPADVALHDAQSVIAREYGFPSWSKLVAHVEEVRARQGITQQIADEFVSAAVHGNINRLRRLLALYPGLPSYSPATKLVWGDNEGVQKLAQDPEFITTKLGPENWAPLEYVCYSHLFAVDPSRYEALEETAKTLIEDGADPDTYHAWEGDPDARLSVLYGACGETGHAGIAKLLLEHGANPNDGESVYHAAQFNRREILDLLLRHGCDISHKDSHWNNTPLFFICGHRPTDGPYQTAVKGVEWLLQNGADPNVSCYKNEARALHAACNSNATELVELLLAYGADPTVQRTDGKTPYDLAMIGGSAKAAAAIAAKGGAHDLSPIDSFLAACARDDKAQIRAILERNPGLRETNEKEIVSAFIKFAEHGVEAGVKNLLEQGTDVNSTLENNETALHFACFTGQEPVVRLLLEHGASMEPKDKTYNGTPVGWALQGFMTHRNVGVVRDLLNAGAPRSQVVTFFDEWDGGTQELRKQVLG